jgi:hypothetical protein
MNPKSILSCSLLALGLVGCWSPADPEVMPGRAAQWSGDSIRAAAINKAIVQQHVIYPYHFVTNSAELNPLGLRDLGVLAEYYTAHPGALSIRRAGAAQKLYDERVVAVMDKLKASGVAIERLAVADTAPGGDGISSERLVHILREPAVLTGGTTGAEGGDDSSSAGASTGMASTMQ